MWTGSRCRSTLTFAWLDGRDAIQLNNIQVNAQIPDSNFNTRNRPSSKRDALPKRSSLNF